MFVFKTFIFTEYLYGLQSSQKRSYTKEFPKDYFKTPERSEIYTRLSEIDSMCTGLLGKENIDPGRNLFKQYQDKAVEPTVETCGGIVYNKVCEMDTKEKETDVSSEGEYDMPHRQGSLTPKGTPIKNLPFSPSQVTSVLMFMTTIYCC